MQSGDHPWGSSHHVPKEARLFQCIILQAIIDIHNELVCPGKRDMYTHFPKKAAYKAAVDWIFSNKQPMHAVRTGVTFRECCDMAGYDPDYWRRRVSSYIDRMTPQDMPIRRGVIMRGDQTNFKRTKGAKNV